MNAESSPEYLVSRIRTLTMPPMRFFYVTGSPVWFDDLDTQLDALLERLDRAKERANLRGAGPNITRYRPVEPGQEFEGMYIMQVGIPVGDGVEPVEDAKIEVLPPYYCAGILLWGSLAHIVAAYDLLAGGMKGAGLEPSGDNREWTYYFESPESPRNLTGIYMGIKTE